jgi:hypothetical protein
MMTLNEAVHAVNEYRREVEMRRMALAMQRSAPSQDWLVPVPHSRLHALEEQAREAAVLRSLLARRTQAARAAQERERHLPPKSNQRPRLDARAAPAA